MAILLTKWGKREQKTNLGFRLFMAKPLFSEVGKVAINKAEIEFKIWFFSKKRARKDTSYVNFDNELRKKSI